MQRLCRQSTQVAWQSTTIATTDSEKCSFDAIFDEIASDCTTVRLADDTRAIWCKIYGFEEFSDLFTPRQLTSLTTFSDLTGKAREQIQADAVAAGLPNDDMLMRDGGQGARAYAEAVSVYLAFAIDRCVDYWSTIATWHASNQQVRSTFARQAIPMTWDYVEANPFSDSSGGWNSLYLSTVSSFNSFGLAQQGWAMQGDASETGELYRQECMISTDPPYYDNIGYADLSDLFYIWLRRSLRELYPEIFETMLVPKTSELVASAYRFDGDSDAANDHFEKGLFKAFESMQSLVDSDYPLTVFYAFKQSEIVVDVDGSNGRSK